MAARLPGGLKRTWPWQKKSAAESAPPAAWTSLDHLGTLDTLHPSWTVIEAMLTMMLKHVKILKIR